MNNRKVCPECGSKTIYILVNGGIVCRLCGYDSRKIEQPTTDSFGSKRQEVYDSVDKKQGEQQ